MITVSRNLSRFDEKARLGTAKRQTFASNNGADWIFKKDKEKIMTEEIKVVGLGGSLAASSNSLAALKIALEGAAEAFISDSARRRL